MKKILLIVVLLISVGSLKAQNWLGYSLSNYAGVNAVLINPAEIADNRMGLDINLAGVSLNFDNTFYGLHDAGFLGSSFRNELNTVGFKTSDDPFSTNAYDQGKFTKLNGVLLNEDVLGPSVLIPLGPKRSISIATRQRLIFNVDNVPTDLAKSTLEGLTYQPLLQQNFTADKLRISMMAWTEEDFTYAQVIPILPDSKVHFFKAGITFKVLQGWDAMYMYGKNLTYNFKNSDTISFYSSTLDYGHTNSIEYNPNSFTEGVQNWGFGGDIGFVYEYRPNHDKYMTTNKKGESVERRDENKYKLKLALSVTDIGGINFNKAPGSYDFNPDVVNWDINALKLNSVKSFDDTLNHRWPNQAAGNKNTFYMSLPTALNLYADYSLTQHFYVNAGGQWSPISQNDPSKVHALTTAWIIPRYEARYFGAGIPITANIMGQLSAGVYFNAGPLYIGSSDIIRNVVGADIKSVNFYVGLKVQIPHRKPKKITDRDGDGVPDAIDNCPDVAGPKENHGCPWPDRDHDGVPDKDDACPDVAGPVANHGCPWPDTDGDGVFDKDDSCPTVAGPPENHGCPWPDRDHDGVPDKDDKCPDVAGPAANHGCPWPDTDGDGVLDKDDSCPTVAGPVENHGCPWPDSDGDGVPDKDDACPHTPGPAWNHGCPVIEKKEEAIIKKAFDNLEFDNGKSTIRPFSFPSLNELAKLLVSKPTYGLKVAGHTDNVGTPEKNMILSHDRAQAVKDYLIAHGVSADRIVVEYYGQTRPIADNKTPQGRQKNRRVEMTVIFQ